MERRIVARYGTGDVVGTLTDVTGDHNGITIYK
jgi:hypothetical protein